MKTTAVFCVLLVLFAARPALLAQQGSLLYESPVERAKRLLQQLDVPARSYIVTVQTIQTSRTLEQLRHMGASLVPSGGEFAPLDTSRSRVSLLDLIGRSRSSHTQKVHVRSGSEATVFQGEQVPVVTTTSSGGVSTQSFSTVDAGSRVTIKALRPLGDRGVELAIGTEQSAITSTDPLPVKRQTVTDTVVQATFGRPVVLASLSSATGASGGDFGGNGAIVIEESRRENAPPFRLGSFTSKRQMSFGGGRTRNRRRGTTLVVLTVEPVEGP